jgi:hypothetical protein
MVPLTFSFSVNANGVFTYDAPAPGVPNWAYSFKNSLKFQSVTGPFTLRLRRTDQAGGTGNLPDPFGGPVKATQVNGAGPWTASVAQINDGLTEAVRHTIWQNNGFIAKYRYVIGARMADGSVAVDDNQSGIHTC